ncbi:MAG TPA: CoA pyrophosphatase [Mycobacteriales bacterium]|nr:CoA pyrophosphatase [Mycobacteriales bacterium]
MIEVKADGLPPWLQPLVEGLQNVEPSEFLLAGSSEYEGARQAAVLVLFGEGANGPDLLLLQRSAHLRNHAGQPAFPGGGVDPDDDGPVATALREAEEETGVDPAGVQVFATLPQLWIPRSGNVVTPVLAWWREPCEVSPVDPGEVASVARVPLADLADPANRVMVRHRLGFVSPAFRVADMLVWGFTAGVIDRLMKIAGWERDWDRGVIEALP